MQENEPKEKREPEMITTDADTVKELVEMKFLTKKMKIKFRTPKQRILSRKYQVLDDNDITSHASEEF